MNRIIKFLLRILRLGALWSITLMLVSASAVIYTFLSGLQDTVFGYISYAFSAYALTALVVGFPKIMEDIKESVRKNKFINSVKSIISKNKYGNLFITDISFRVKFSLYSSLFINLFYVAFKMFSAFYYSSFWFGAEAVFYVAFSFVLFILLRNMRKGGKNLRYELQTYRFCGYLLFALNAALIGVVYQMIHQGMGKQYPGLLIYAEATYAFVCFTVAIMHMVKYRKYNSPVLSAVKLIKFARALIAMFSLQIAMFASFGSGEDFEGLMNSISGGCVCFAIFCMAVFMVVRANRKLKNI